jgi:ABC-type sugar transport system permease subunit
MTSVKTAGRERRAEEWRSPSVGQRWRRTAIRKWGPAYVLILPAIVLLVVMMLYPLIQTFIFSFSDVALPGLDATFVGLKNFLAVVQDPETGQLVQRTVVWILATVLLRFLLGFVGALIFNARVRGTIWLRVLVILPWTLPSVVSANLWRWILQSDIGVLNETLKSWGLGAFAADWLGNPQFTLGSVIVAYSWAGFPFVMLLLLAGMQGIPDHLYEAGQVDGATTWQLFRHITVPSLKGIMIICLILEVVSAVNSFDTIMVMTGGGPANATMIFGIDIYRTGFQNFDFGGASALSVFLFLGAFAVFIIYSIVGRRSSAANGSEL